MNKKGAVTDLAVFMILVFIISIFGGVMFFVGHQIHTSLLNAAPQLQINNPNTNITDTIEKTVGMADSSNSMLFWGTGVIIFGLILSILITSFIVKTHPVMFIPYIFVIFVMTIISASISNAYEKLLQDPVLGASFVNFTAQNFIMLNLPMIVIVVGLIAGALMFINFVRGGEI